MSSGKNVVHGSARIVRTAAILGAAALFVCASGCSSDDDEPSDPAAEVTAGMHRVLLEDVKRLHEAAVAISTNAPSPTDRGWSETEDADALAATTDAWLEARGAYERIEGALAPLFPDIDAAIDARYEDFMEELGSDGDPDLFDDQGVTGMHAIERILFAHEMPSDVIAVESAVPGYTPAAWPANADEAAEFKTKLSARLVTDTQTLLDQWTPQRIDLGGAFGGLIALMNEQREKVIKAASEEEESRYARRTMADLRENLAGTRAIYALFSDWVKSKQGGPELDAEVNAAFEELETAYAAVQGDAMPPLPADWSSETPSDDDLQSDFGKLYVTVQAAVDPNRPGSAVDAMNRVAVLLGFPQFEAE